MKTFNEAAKLQKYCDTMRMQGKKIALIPTMGCLHEGHLSLIAAAKKKGADEIIVSIFVNPIQFGPKEDLNKYPRCEKADVAKCKKAGVTAIFLPKPTGMYQRDHSVYIEERELGKGLCGQRRPGHFRGVCTVVAKLFNITHPHFAFFGHKDYQQALIIKRMVRDLNFDIKVFVEPIVREESGLALSSRNCYLTDDDRVAATCIYRALCAAKKDVKLKKSLMWNPYKTRIVRLVRKHRLNVDYVEAVDGETLQPVTILKKGVVILMAVYVNGTRLIDNMEM